MRLRHHANCSCGSCHMLPLDDGTLISRNSIIYYGKLVTALTIECELSNEYGDTQWVIHTDSGYFTLLEWQRAEKRTDKLERQSAELTSRINSIVSDQDKGGA